MSVTNFLAGEFNGEQVVRHFGVSPQKTAIIAAMHFMFRIMKDEVSFPNMDLKGCYKEIAAFTQDEVHYRYLLLNEYAKNFFKGKSVDYDALAIALVCNEYTPHINEPYQTKDGDLVEQYDGIKPKLAARAQAIWDDANLLLTGVAGRKDVSREALFLAHVLIFEEIAKHETAFEENLDADYSEVAKSIRHARAFLRPKTKIGSQLKNFMDYTEQELFAARPEEMPPPPPPRPRPHLYLVPKHNDFGGP